jgi:hypothetical protein
MNLKDHANHLIQEWRLCADARPRNDAVGVRLEKDRCEEWAIQLMTTSMWGSADDLSEACHQFESRLKILKEKIVIEVLKNGSV